MPITWYKSRCFHIKAGFHNPVHQIHISNLPVILNHVATFSIWPDSVFEYYSSLLKTDFG